jgi:hypothetical protein
MTAGYGSTPEVVASDSLAELGSRVRAVRRDIRGGWIRSTPDRVVEAMP